MFNIPATKSSPEVTVTGDSHTILVQGKSFPEDATHFYQLAAESLNFVKGGGSPVIVLDFFLEYISSASVAAIFSFLEKAAKLQEAGKKIKVKWKYEADEEVIKSIGEKYQEVLNLDFEFIEVEED